MRFSSWKRRCKEAQRTHRESAKCTERSACKVLRDPVGRRVMVNGCPALKTADHRWRDFFRQSDAQITRFGVLWSTFDRYLGCWGLRVAVFDNEACVFGSSAPRRVRCLAPAREGNDACAVRAKRSNHPFQVRQLTFQVAWSARRWPNARGHLNSDFGRLSLWQLLIIK